jgi:DNA-binding PadR family transcriptional regulator
LKRVRSTPPYARLEAQGLIDSEWGESDNNRKAKFYRQTAAGRRRLGTEAAKWNEMAALMAAILEA